MKHNTLVNHEFGYFIGCGGVMLLMALHTVSYATNASTVPQSMPISTQSVPPAELRNVPQTGTVEPVAIDDAKSRAVEAVLAEAKAAEARRDYLNERELLEPLARDGNAQAQAMLGFLWRFGLGAPEDHAQAAAWFQKAAEQGNAWAQHNYGNALLKGQGIEQDIPKGIIWLEKSGENGFFAAYATLALLYTQGKDVEQNSAKGLAYYIKAANAGILHAIFALGSKYEQGQGVEMNLPLAADWYRKGADLGYFMCQYNLGRMYASGLGMPRDLVQAYKWALLAAESAPEDTSALRDALKPHLSAAQLTEAMRLADEWRKAHAVLKLRKL